MFKVSVFLLLLVALIGLSAAQYRVKRQSFSAGITPNGYQATLNPYNSYNPYNPYEPYNPYRPYQHQHYPGFPGPSVYPGHRPHNAAGILQL